MVMVMVTRPVSPKPVSVSGIKARNSIFVTSGTNIIEGGSGPGIVSSEAGKWGKSSEQAMMWKGSTSNHFPSYGSFS